jgi:hypothetical protein
MRRNDKINTRITKQVARRKYAERQIDKWIKWRIDVKGYMYYDDLVKLQEEHNIKCYG